MVSTPGASLCVFNMKYVLMDIIMILKQALNFKSDIWEFLGRLCDELQFPVVSS